MARRKEQVAKKQSGFLPQGKYLKPEEIEYEFGGTAGVVGMLVGFPLLMYYMWISAQFYNGSLALPAEGQSWYDFIVRDLYGKYFVNYAIPTTSVSYTHLTLPTKA